MRGQTRREEKRENGESNIVNMSKKGSDLSKAH